MTFALQENNKSFKVRPILSYSKHNMIDQFNFEITPEVKKGLEISNFKSLTKGVQMLDEVVIIGNKKFYNEPQTIVKSFKKLNFKELPFSKGNVYLFLKPILIKYESTIQPLKILFLNEERVKLNDFNGIDINQVREIRMGTSIF